MAPCFLPEASKSVLEKHFAFCICYLSLVLPPSLCDGTMSASMAIVYVEISPASFGCPPLSYYVVPPEGQTPELLGMLEWLDGRTPGITGCSKAENKKEVLTADKVAKLLQQYKKEGNKMQLAQPVSRFFVTYSDDDIADF